MPTANPLLDRYKSYCLDRVSNIGSLAEALDLYTVQLCGFVSDEENHRTLQQAIDYVRSFDDAIAVLDAINRQSEAFPSRNRQRHSANRCAIEQATTLSDWVRLYRHGQFYCFDDADIAAKASTKAGALIQATTAWEELWGFYLAVPEHISIRSIAWKRIQAITTSFDQALRIWNKSQPPSRDVGGWAWNKMGELAQAMPTFEELAAALELISGGQPDRFLPAIIEQMSIKARTLGELLFTFDRARDQQFGTLDRIVTRLRQLVVHIDDFDTAVNTRTQIEAIKTTYPFDTVRQAAMERCVELAPDLASLRKSLTPALACDRIIALYRQRLNELATSTAEVIAAFNDYTHAGSIHASRQASPPYIARAIELARTPDDWALLTSHYLLRQCFTAEQQNQITTGLDAALTAVGYPPAEASVPTS